MRRHLVFLLWRLAAKLDLPYVILAAKTLTRIVAANEAQGAGGLLTVQVEVAQQLAERLDDWSEPVQIAFHNTSNGWQMYVRACESQVAISETIRARAMRQ